MESSGCLVERRETGARIGIATDVAWLVVLRLRCRWLVWIFLGEWAVVRPGGGLIGIASFHFHCNRLVMYSWVHYIEHWARAYLSPVTSVTYPVGIPPSRRASMVGSRVLIVFHRDNTTRFNGPGTSFSLKLSSVPASSSFSVWKPTSRCSASTICAARRRTSAGGTWARFAISSVSSVIRSAVLMLFRSSEGRIWAYRFVGKEGRVDRRSMCGREKLKGEVGAAEVCRWGVFSVSYTEYTLTSSVFTFVQ